MPKGTNRSRRVRAGAGLCQSGPAPRPGSHTTGDGRLCLIRVPPERLLQNAEYFARNLCRDPSARGAQNAQSGSRRGMILALIANEGNPADQQRQNRKRVRPPGSVAKVTIAERGSMRYTFHGGGPCDGALNGAVMPDPLASGSAGQPLSAHAFAVRATAPGSVTRAASPSMTMSASRTDTAIEHRVSRATLRPFRVPAPVWNQNVPSSHRAPTAVTCGLPSWLMVDSQVVREFTASGAGAGPPSRLPPKEPK